MERVGFKKNVFTAVIVVITLISSCDTHINNNLDSKISNEIEVVPLQSLPITIERGQVALITDGFQVSCVFKEDSTLRKLHGKMLVEIYNWDLSDDVKFNDFTTYARGSLVASSEFECTVDEFDEEKKTDRKTFKIIADHQKLLKTYLSVKFTFTPEGNYKAITGGSMYETL